MNLFDYYDHLARIINIMTNKHTESVSANQILWECTAPSTQKPPLLKKHRNTAQQRAKSSQVGHVGVGMLGGCNPSGAVHSE